MPRPTVLDNQWQRLMGLCETESTFRSKGGYSRLLNLIASDIAELASEMGFSPRSIASRDFRARREGDHIVGIVTD
jgi:AraC-like DNA-binding protein